MIDPHDHAAEAVAEIVSTAGGHALPTVVADAIEHPATRRLGDELAALYGIARRAYPWLNATDRATADAILAGTFADHQADLADQAAADAIPMPFDPAHPPRDPSTPAPRTDVWHYTTGTAT